MIWSFQRIYDLERNFVSDWLKVERRTTVSRRMEKMRQNRLHCDRLTFESHFDWCYLIRLKVPWEEVWKNQTSFWFWVKRAEEEGEATSLCHLKGAWVFASSIFWHGPLRHSCFRLISFKILSLDFSWKSIFDPESTFKDRRLAWKTYSSSSLSFWTISLDYKSVLR